MVRVGLVTPRLWVRVSGPAGFVDGGSESPVLSSTFNTTTEVRPLSKAPDPQLLPGCVQSVCKYVCSLFTAVCVQLDGLNAKQNLFPVIKLLNIINHFKYMSTAGTFLIL